MVMEVVGGLVVKALDCGVRGHRFESHLLLPRKGFSPGKSWNFPSRQERT